MRIARIGLVGALLFGATACQTDDGGPVTRTLPPLAFVRYINAVPDTNNLTVRFIDQIDNVPQSFFNVPFRGLAQGGYQGVEAGSQRFRVFRHDPNLSTTTGGLGATTEQLADTSFDFVAGQYYTILHYGYARTGQTPAQRVYILTDGLPAVNTSVAVRIMNVNPQMGAIDIFNTATNTTALAGAPLFANLTASATTPTAYTNLLPGQFSGRIAFTGTLISESGTAAPAGIAGTSAADPVAGATVGGSVLTGFVFPPAVDGSAAQTYPTSLASGRVVAPAGITNAGGTWTIADSIGNWNQRAGFCAPTTYRWCRVSLSVTGQPATQFLVSNNAANSVSTTADLSAYAAAAGRKLFTVTAFNSDIVWFSDRQPPRTTTP